MALPRHPLSEPGPASAAEEAYNHVLDSIRRGAYGPGDRLKTEDIAATIGMSRMPVREAFRRLATEGLLVMRPNRGAAVCTFSLADIEEIFEMRSVLEGLAVRLAIERVDEPALAELDQLLERMERASENNDGEWLTVHRYFHEYVCALSGRQRLLRQIAGLHTALEPYLRLWLIRIDQPVNANAQREHREIVEAIRGRDPQRAEAVMQEHIRTTAPDLARVL